MYKKPIALFDMDGTLCDYEGAIRRDYDYQKGPGDPDYSPNNKEIPHLRRRVDFIRSKPGWWLNLETLQLGFDVLEILEKYYDIHIASKGPRNCQNSWTEKLLWVQKHIPDVTTHITQDKSLIYGDILVDDYPPYLEAWLERHTNGIGIMPIHYYNKDFKHESVIPYDGDKEKLEYYEYNTSIF